MCAHSFIHTKSVETTLLLLCTAVKACFASSFTVTSPAPTITAPPTTNSLRLPLFFAIGFVASLTLVTKAFRCGGTTCLRTQARQVQGLARRRKRGNGLNADIM